MHQRLDGGAQKAVVDEEVLLDAERGVAPLEIAGAIVVDPVTQRQILGARRRADRIGLDEAKPLDRLLQRGRTEQAAAHGEAAQIVETDGHG